MRFRRSSGSSPARSASRSRSSGSHRVLRRRERRIAGLVAFGVPVVRAVPAVQEPDLDAGSFALLESPPLAVPVPDVVAPAAFGSGSGSVTGAIEELPQRRDAFTRVFRGDDGSLTIDGYTTPINYETVSGWAPINNTVSPDVTRPGWVRTTGKPWTVSFGPATDGLERSRAGIGSAGRLGS